MSYHSNFEKEKGEIFLFPSLKFNVYLTEIFDTYYSVTIYIYIYDFNDTIQNIFEVGSRVLQ